MSGIKRTPADHWFSKCVRERANWTCEKCGAVHEQNSKGLHCSHHKGRRAWSVRLDPLNAEALCYGCHSHYGGTQERLDQCLTTQQQEILIEKRNDNDLGKRIKRTKGKGEIARHYREEFERMQGLRAIGNFSRLEFMGYE